MSVRNRTAPAAGWRQRLLACCGLWVFAALVFLLLGCAPASLSETSPAPTVRDAQQRWKGNANAPAVIEEWTDLQ